MAATIVLADDEPELRAIYAACLRSAGHTVHEAADGREAIALVLDLQPALLLLDVWMPGFNGFEVLEQLRRLPVVSSLKVVMLSNLGDADTRLEGFSIGVIDYWVKGISLAELREKVDLLLDEAVPAPETT